MVTDDRFVPKPTDALHVRIAAADERVILEDVWHAGKGDGRAGLLEGTGFLQRLYEPPNHHRVEVAISVGEATNRGSDKLGWTELSRPHPSASVVASSNGSYDITTLFSAQICCDSANVWRMLLIPLIAGSRTEVAAACAT